MFLVLSENWNGLPQISGLLVLLKLFFFIWKLWIVYPWLNPDACAIVDSRAGNPSNLNFPLDSRPNLADANSSKSFDQANCESN